MGYKVEFDGAVPREMSQGGSERHLFGPGAPGLMRPEWNLSYNYTPSFEKAFKEVDMIPTPSSPDDHGLWRICGKTPRQQISDIEKAIGALAGTNDANDDYWSGTDGNARKILEQMLQISIWWLAHHPDKSDQTEEGVWLRHAW